MELERPGCHIHGAQLAKGGGECYLKILSSCGLCMEPESMN
jgi:hypothetical protein